MQFLNGFKATRPCEVRYRFTRLNISQDFAFIVSQSTVTGGIVVVVVVVVVGGLVVVVVGVGGRVVVVVVVTTGGRVVVVVVVTTGGRVVVVVGVITGGNVTGGWDGSVVVVTTCEPLEADESVLVSLKQPLKMRHVRIKPDVLYKRFITGI